MSQDTNIPNLIINKLNKQQYEGITPNNTELYFITDEDAYLASNQGSGNAGKVLVVGNDGIVVPQTSPSGTTNYEDLSNKPSINNVALSGNKTASDLGFANVAMTGEYSDLVNTPVLGSAAYANTSDFATAAEGNLATTAVQPGDLANVATTGEYSDLLNTPMIPAAQVNADWNAVSGVAEILNKPNLSNVATTGDYNDLTNKPTIPTNLANVAFTGEYDDLYNKPTIPTVSDATIVITQGGVQKGSFTLNQVSGDTIALDAGGGGGSLPSQTGHSGEFLTTDGTDASWAPLANIATTGEYSDLVNAPSLANVATTGEYSDLLNTPTIPNVPVVVQDFYVNGTTGAINCTFSATPTTKTVHTIIGNTVINGTWSGNVFTPNTADDILNNANGFVVSVF